MTTPGMRGLHDVTHGARPRLCGRRPMHAFCRRYQYERFGRRVKRSWNQAGGAGWRLTASGLYVYGAGGEILVEYRSESRSSDIGVSEIVRFFSQRSCATAYLRRRRVPGKKVVLQSSCRHTAASTRVR
jgi:hypothetical protein